MKKDKIWLKEEIKKDAKKYPHYHDERDDLIKMMASFHDVIALIDQLEEPEQDINAAYDLLQENTTLSQEDFDLYWNCINDGVAVRELKESSTNNSNELKQAEKDMKEVNQKSKDVLNSLK